MNKAACGRIALVVVLAAGLGAALLYRHRFDAGAIESWVMTFGALAPLVFIVLFAAGVSVAVPGLIFTLAGGALFGPYWGTLYNLTGATIGATVAFLVARHIAADWLSERLGGRTERVVRGVESEGWRFVAFVRLVPLFPFSVINFALGLTRLRLDHYVFTTFVCMIPAAIAFTYVGYAGREALAGGEGTIEKGLLALGLIAVVGFLPRLVRRLRGPSKDGGAD